ncbi:MAG: metallophosphoesterase [Clostridia bacterium]|nr:metallophosphoesterase [Clostridia bacterium]
MNNKKKPSNRILKRAVPLFLIVAVILSVIYAHFDNLQYQMGITVYEMESEKIDRELTVALVCDLHNHRYGEENSELIEAVKKQEPDIIAVVGDIITRSEPDDISVLRPLLEKFCEIAPTYFALGNHEQAIVDTTNVIEEIEVSGAILLSQEHEDIEIDGNKIRVGCLDSNPEKGCPGRVFLDDYSAEDEPYKLLLCHQPEYMHYFMKCEIDLVLCGHAHGGQVRLPDGQGIYSPEQGFMPKFTEGVFKSETATMVISRGLGNAIWIPRINNPAELVIVKVS